MRAPEAAEWHEPYFIFKLTQDTVYVRQTDPPHCARAPTGRLREKQEMGEEAVVQVSDNCGLDLGRGLRVEGEGCP